MLYSTTPGADPAPGPACHALGLIRQPYEIEATIEDAPHDQRREVREREAKPIVDAFFDGCEHERTGTLRDGAVLGHQQPRRVPQRRRGADLAAFSRGPA